VGTALQRVISGFVISDENNWFLEKAIVKPCASLAIVETKQIVLPIELCARVKSNQLSYQLWFVEWEKKQRAKAIVFCGIGEKTKLSFQLLFVGIGRKKTMTKPSATLLKRIKEITSKE